MRRVVLYDMYHGAVGHSMGGMVLLAYVLHCRAMGRAHGLSRFAPGPARHVALLRGCRWGFGCAGDVVRAVSDSAG